MRKSPYPSRRVTSTGFYSPLQPSGSLFSPSAFWVNFAASYKGLPWEEDGEGRLSIIAENYSYLLDPLVQARLFYLSGKREDEHFQ
jgi:hypothetical protein